MNNKNLSKEISLFRGMETPETATLVGYGAIIEELNIDMPLPNQLSLISSKRRSYESIKWKVYSSKAAFQDSLYKHLVFAIKNEGINLLFFKKLFQKLSKPDIVSLLKIEPTGMFTRKIWFLYEWLFDELLDIPDLTIKNYVPLLDDKLQFGISNGVKSNRHRIINNLPGTKDFCPLIFRTDKLDNYIASNINQQKEKFLIKINKDVLQRASSFLLLQDSKASFTIEGESPKSKRTARWGQAIAQAGSKNLTKEELLRLQQLVIENDRFLEMGFRKKGGFIGAHDRATLSPIPDHISARWQDLHDLTNGLISTNNLLVQSDINSVLAAAIIAFGFVFIHPFEDGNGRIHRYLIHHILAKKQFSSQGIIFPISASILNQIDDYRKILESYSQPLLDYIDWEETEDHNVDVKNNTVDFYRYFDLTLQTEFLYDCVNDTILNIIPNEIKYLQQYDKFKMFIDNRFEMPDKMVALLVSFLEQNSGTISNRAREKEFNSLKDDEVLIIENKFNELFF